MAYNRDQRIANHIIDALVGFNDAVSARTVYRSTVAGKSVHVVGEMTFVRVKAILDALVEHGSVTEMKASEHDPEGERYGGVDVYFVDPRNIRLVLEVARGEFVA